MLKKTGLILALLAAGIAPAAAQSTCVEPVAPAAVDGNSVTQPQLVAAIASVKDFQAKSDTYQQCLSDNLDAQKAAAIKNNTTFDPTLQQVMLAKIAANQQAKEQVVKDINTAVVAFKQKGAASK
jgi:hypothetical protein